MVSPSQTLTPVAAATCTTASSAKLSVYPAIRSMRAIGVVSSRSSVPPVRSRSIAMDVSRNMIRNGKNPSSAGAIRENTGAELKT